MPRGMSQPASQAEIEEPHRRTLSIGSVLGGGGVLDDVDQALRRLAGIVRREDESCSSPPGAAAVNVVYYFPGTIWRPDFEGIRTGKWVKAKRLLVVQVAVPEALSGDSERILAFLRQSLVDAVDLAESNLEERRPKCSAGCARRVAARAATMLTA